MPHMPRVERPSRSSTRSRISPAALFVNVIARISCTRARPVWTRDASRWVSTRVLPDPAAGDGLGEPVGEHARLAGPGAGEDQERPVAVGDRRLLRRVEPLEKAGD